VAGALIRRGHLFCAAWILRAPEKFSRKVSVLRFIQSNSLHVSTLFFVASVYPQCLGVRNVRLETLIHRALRENLSIYLPRVLVSFLRRGPLMRADL